MSTFVERMSDRAVDMADFRRARALWGIARLSKCQWKFCDRDVSSVALRHAWTVRRAHCLKELGDEAGVDRAVCDGPRYRRPGEFASPGRHAIERPIRRRPRRSPTARAGVFLCGLGDRFGNRDKRSRHKYFICGITVS